MEQQFQALDGLETLNHRLQCRPHQAAHHPTATAGDAVRAGGSWAVAWSSASRKARILPTPLACCGQSS